MPLTKSDKLIIVGAVVLALAVVAGLAAWRKPHLFTGSRPAPEMTTRDFTAPAPAPSAPPAATTPVPPAPPIPPAPASPAPPPAAATPTTAPPGAAPISQQAPAAPPGISGPGISSPVADTSPAPGRPASPPHEAAPSAPAALSAPGTPAKEPVSPEIVSQHPLFAGDQALDKMFSDMSQEAAAPKVDTGKRPAAPEQTPPGQAAAPHVPAPDPVPATAEALDLPVQKPGLAAKKPVKDKPVATGKPAASPSRGAVVAVSAADKPGEYVLTVTTTSPVGEVTRLYMDGPPRLVIDLDGRWTYTGPLSLPGKSPLIRMVRVGKHPDRLRLVLDLAPEATTRLREAPVLDRTSNGVVIRLPK